MNRDDWASVSFLLLVLLLGVVSLSGCSTNQWRAGFHAANAADAYTTLQGLDRGCTESMPLAGPNPSDSTIMAIAIGQAILAELVCGHAEESERVCWQVFTAIKLGAGAWNASQSCP